MCYNISAINCYLGDNLLGNTPLLGVVEAVFPSVCLIESQAGQLLALQNDNAVLSPMSLVVPGLGTFANLAVAPGKRVFHYPEQQILVIDNITFDYSKCRYFSSQALILCQKLPYLAYLNELEAYLESEEASLYSCLKGIPDGSEEMPLEYAVSRHIQEAAEHIGEGLKSACVPYMEQGLKELFGLGPGLTPSGDDFFLGLATALLTSQEYAGLFAHLRPRILELAYSSTTRVSQAFINSFLDNCYSLPVCQLIERLNNRDVSGFAACLPEIGSFGHSSGHDYLSGLWWGFQFMLREK